ncbi:MAG TPA: hypothetical protein PKD61_38700, partial [Polyangiaceae bacterium]|nr:hypothetical protein [Polyangiaceae bacterium]
DDAPKDDAPKDDAPKDDANGVSDEEVPSDADLDEDSDAMRSLLRGAFDKEESAGEPHADVLRGVQDKLRKRSGGKFYADGWSTARHPPTMTYLWTSMIMLAVVVIAYAVLAPLVDEAKEVLNEPAPVQLIPPKRPR